MPSQYDINIQIDHHYYIFFIAAKTGCAKKVLDMVGPQFKLAISSLNQNLVFPDHWHEVDEFEHKFDCCYKMCCWCIGTEENDNFTNAQIELLFW